MLLVFCFILYLVKGNKEYVGVDEELTFDLAESYCLDNLGTNLASIHSDSDMISASNACKSIIILSDYDFINTCFIGLTDNNGDYIYTYTDNTDNDYSASWKKGRPKISKSKSGESIGDITCVYMKYDSKKNKFEWEEKDCSDTLSYFLCNAPDSIPSDIINLDSNQIVSGEYIISHNYQLRFIIDESNGDILAQEKDKDDNDIWITYWSANIGIDVDTYDGGNYISSTVDGSIYVYNSNNEIVYNLYVNSDANCIGNNIVINNYGAVGVYNNNNTLCDTIIHIPNTQSVNSVTGQFGGIRFDALDNIITRNTNDKQLQTASRINPNTDADADDDSLANIFCGGNDDKPLWASLLSMNEDLWNELIEFDDDNIGIIQQHIQCTEVIYVMVINAFPGGISQIGRGLNVLNLLLELIQQIDLTDEFIQDIIAEINNIILTLLNEIDVPDIINWENHYNNDDTQIFNPFSLINEFAKLLSKLICDKKFGGTPKDFLNNIIESGSLTDLVSTYNNSIYSFLNDKHNLFFDEDLRNELLTNNFYQNFAFAPTFGMQICFTLIIPGCVVCKFNICIKHTNGISINLRGEYSLFEGRISILEIPIPPPDSFGMEINGIKFYDFLSNYQDVINDNKREIFTIGAALDFSGFSELDYILQIWDYFNFFMDELPIATFNDLPINWINNKISKNKFLLSLLSGGISASLEVVGVLDIDTLLKCNGFRIVIDDTCGIDDGISGKILISNGIRGKIDTIKLGTDWMDDMAANLKEFMIKFIQNHIENGGLDPNVMINSLENVNNELSELGENLTENILDSTQKFFQEIVVKLILSLLTKIINLYNNIINKINIVDVSLTDELNKITSVSFCIYLPSFNNPFHEKICPSLQFIDNLNDFSNIIFEQLIDGLKIPDNILNIDNDYNLNVNQILENKINILTNNMNKLIDNFNINNFIDLLWNALSSTMNQIEDDAVEFIEKTAKFVLNMLLNGIKFITDQLKTSLNNNKIQFDNILNDISDIIKISSIPLPYGGNININFKINVLNDFSNIIYDHIINSINLPQNIANTDQISITKLDATSIKTTIDNKLNNIIKPILNNIDNFDIDAFADTLKSIFQNLANQIEDNIVETMEGTAKFALNTLLSGLQIILNQLKASLNTAKGQFNSVLNSVSTIAKISSIPLPWGGSIRINFNINQLSDFSNIIFDHIINSIDLAEHISNVDSISITKYDTSSIKTTIDDKLNNILKPMFLNIDNFNIGAFENTLKSILYSLANQGEDLIIGNMQETARFALRTLLQGLKAILDGVLTAVRAVRGDFESSLSSVSNIVEPVSIPLPWGDNINFDFKIAPVPEFSNIIFGPMESAITLSSSISDVNAMRLSKTDTSAIRGTVDGKLNSILEPMFNTIDDFDPNSFKNLLTRLLTNGVNQGEAFGNSIKTEMESVINSTLDAMNTPIDSLSSAINTAITTCKSIFNKEKYFGFCCCGGCLLGACWPETCIGYTLSINSLLPTDVSRVCDSVFSPLTTAIDNFPQPRTAADFASLFSAQAVPEKKSDNIIIEEVKHNIEDNIYIPTPNKLYMMGILYTIIVIMFGLFTGIMLALIHCCSVRYCIKSSKY